MAYGNPSRLYVLELANGVIKAGITSRGEERLQQHARTLRIARHVMTGFVSGVEAEGDLLKRMARIGSVCHGREWFTGIGFATAAQMAQQVARKFSNANPISMGHLMRKSVAALRFNDKEIAVLDAYCALTGTSRSAACRQLVLAVAEGVGA